MSTDSSTLPSGIPDPPVDPPRRVVKAVGPRLRRLLYVVMALLAVLFANSAYLGSITLLSWKEGVSYQNYFYQWMFLGHLLLGFVLIVPFLIFAVLHMRNTYLRKNRRAVRVGYALFAISLVILITGLALPVLTSPAVAKGRSLAYWLHIVSPLVAIWLYILHRLTGPRLRWKAGLGYAAAVAVGVVLMALNHAQDPRRWNVRGPASGVKYFEPSLARTTTGNFINADVLMMDDYCQKCHADVHAAWAQSPHRHSSFNNPAYLASVRETRKVSLERDGSVQSSRWCAGCHDAVPFFSGAFDDPKFDDVHHKTAQAGITCTTCHAITNVNSTRGNADFTIEEPIHYPFARSDNSFLQWVNQQLVKAKPEFHKKTFLKPLHQTAEFCSTCHKVHLPYELTKYKEFLRGQNHFDPYLLSGVSGHGAKAFYYPEVAKENCAACHMPWQPSRDIAARPYQDGFAVHNHLFPGANTGIAWLKDKPEAIKAVQEFMKGTVRVDLFGLKEQGTVDGKLHAPLRPVLPELQPGSDYLLETVVRTLKVGHPFTQGTVDSNEVWLDVTLMSGGKVIGRNGGLDAEREVDPWSHFINVFMLDETGRRIDRRNPQDIRVPLYNHQVPPGAGQVVHYGFKLPEDVTGPVTIELKLQYRKFDKQYVDFFTRQARPGDLPIRGFEPGQSAPNPLPITTMATDTITLPVRGMSDALAEQKPPEIPPWQRWNDYGIGLFLEGKAELKQAADAFGKVEELKRFDGPLNLARVLHREGRLTEAVAALNRAKEFTDPPPPPWALSWFTGLVNRQEGNLEDAEQNFRSILATKIPAKKFDFSLDYEVTNELAGTLFDQAKRFRGAASVERTNKLQQAAELFRKTLTSDPENVAAHYGLQQVYSQLGEAKLADEHRVLHQRYKEDDIIRGRAIPAARERYPAANHAAEALVIYPLQRAGAPGLTPVEDPAAKQTAAMSDEEAN